MSVLSVEKVPENWTASKSIEGNGASYEGFYRVKVDDPEDGPAVVLAASGLPELGSSYSFGNDSDSNAFLTDLSPTRENQSDRTKWLVRANWEPRTETQDLDENGSPTANPVTAVPKVEFSLQHFTKPVENAVFLGFTEAGPGPGLGVLQRNANGVIVPILEIGEVGPIMSSSGEVYDPPVEKDDVRVIMRITVASLTFDPDWFLWMNTINSDAFIFRTFGMAMALERHTAKLNDITASQAMRDNVIFWRISLELGLNPAAFGWDVEILDQGLKQTAYAGAGDQRGGTIDPAEVQPVRAEVPPQQEIIDPRGNPITQPWPLNGLGQPAGLVNIGGALARVPIKYTLWQTYPEQAFAPLLGRWAEPIV